MKNIIILFLLLGSTTCVAQKLWTVTVEGNVEYLKSKEKVVSGALLKKNGSLELQEGSYLGLMDGKGKIYEYYGPGKINIESLSPEMGKLKLRKLKSYEDLFLSSNVKSKSFSPIFSSIYFPNPISKRAKVSNDSNFCIKWIRFFGDSTKVTLRYGDGLETQEIKDTRAQELIVDLNRLDSPFFFFTLNESAVVGSGGFKMDDSFVVQMDMGGHSYDGCVSSSPLENFIVGAYLENLKLNTMAHSYYRQAFELAPFVKVFEKKFLESKLILDSVD
jgi:hypothetical protein